MRSLARVLLSLLLVLAASAPIPAPAHAATSWATMWLNDAHAGNAGCTGYTKDPNLLDGIAGGTGQCSFDYDNDIESLTLSFASASVCWIFYSGPSYSGTAYVFHDQLSGFVELPTSQDNLFSSYAKGTQGVGATCIRQ